MQNLKEKNDSLTEAQLILGIRAFKVQTILQSLNHPNLAEPLNCCPYLSCKVGCTFWPKVNQADDKNHLEESLELICKFFEQKTKLTGFRYKLSFKSKN